jgi:hypothetical protein
VLVGVPWGTNFSAQEKDETSRSRRFATGALNAFIRRFAESEGFLF